MQEKEHIPMFMSPQSAAEYFGLNHEYIRELLEKRVKPLPHLTRGTHKKVCIPLAEEYLREECIQ